MKLSCPNCGATQFKQLPDGTRDCVFCGTHYMLAVNTVPAPPPAPRRHSEGPLRVDPFDPAHANEATRAFAGFVVFAGVAACLLLIVFLVAVVVAVLN